MRHFHEHDICKRNDTINTSKCNPKQVTSFSTYSSPPPTLPLSPSFPQILTTRTKHFTKVNSCVPKVALPKVAIGIPPKVVGSWRTVPPYS